MPLVKTHFSKVQWETTPKLYINQAHSVSRATLRDVYLVAICEYWVINIWLFQLSNYIFNSIFNTYEFKF